MSTPDRYNTLLHGQPGDVVHELGTGEPVSTLEVNATLSNAFGKIEALQKRVALLEQSMSLTLSGDSGEDTDDLGGL